MGLDGRAIRQQRVERRAFDGSIDVMDDWVQERIRYILTSLPPPSPDLDEAGIAGYAEELQSFVEEEITALSQEAKQVLATARRRAIRLGLGATERLVAAQLPTAEEVRRGHVDTDRTR